MEERDIDNIVEKVKKLLALSKSPNQAEAELAAEKAREMIMKYNLSAEDLDEQEILRYGFLTSRKKPKVWRLVLAKEISEFYFCRFLIVENREGCRLEIIGKRHHALIAESMFNYLEQAIMRITQKSCNKNAKYKFRESFKYGMAVDIATRLRQMKRAREQQVALDETALILREDQQVENYFNTLSTTSYKMKTTGTKKNAFERGCAAGAGVGLGEQVTHNTRRVAQ